MMIDSTTTNPSHPATAVMITQREAVGEAVAEALTPAGFVVLPAADVGEALEWARDLDPDVVLVDRGDEGQGLGVVRALHEHSDFHLWIPIVLLSEGDVDRDLRLEALSAGAWEALAVPLDVEQTLLQLARMIASKRETDEALEEAWVDEAGLYSWDGLVDGVETLVAHAARYNRPMACVACGPEDSVWDVDTAGRVAEVCRRITRGSDVLGLAWKGAELLVLAPDTGEEGARLLGERLIAAVADQAETVLRAGFFAVEDAATFQEDPAEILLRATRALRTAQAGSTGEPVRWTEPADDDGSPVTPR
jgi:CheY-like chemotaxis protein